jgi:putative ABC transport system permease protein
MSFTLSLAWRTLVRRPRRMALFVAGVTVAAAVLLDMVMLAQGLQDSLTGLLEATGYQVRVVPKGLLPFESGAAVINSRAVARQVQADPRVEEAVPLWGQTVYVSRPGSDVAPLAAFSYGAPVRTTPALRIREGRTLQRPGELLIDRLLADELGLTVGDSLSVGLEPDPAVGALRSRMPVEVAGIADFMFASEGAWTVAAVIDDLWSMAGTEVEPAALVLIRVASEDDAYAVARDLRTQLSGIVDVYAIPEIIDAAGDRLTYFQQLSLVLGTVSLIVAFLLVATLLTLSVNERWGEIAALRAIGVTRDRMLSQVAWQGLLISAAGTIIGFTIGLVVARYLDAILTAFPGLPADVSFFVFQWDDALTSALLLVGTGLLAGLYPAWRAASVNIAQILREEIE